MLRSPANACAANSAEIAARQLLVASTSRRRSTASMIGPPASPPTIDGGAGGQPDPADRGRRPGQRVDLQRDGEGRHLRRRGRTAATRP